MIVVYTICLLLVVSVTWMMFARITLNLDSNRRLYWIKWQGLGMIQFILKDQTPRFRFKLLFWQKDVCLFDLRSPKKPAPEKDTPEKPKKRSFFRNRRLKLLPLLRSFEVKTLCLNLDTDDYVVNSYLYPLFHFLNRGKHEFRINYQGRISFHLEVENRLYRIVSALIF